MKKGFTLIELLVVIAIIGLLSSIVLVALDLPGRKAAARLAKVLEFSQSMQNAIGDELVGSWTFENVAGGKTPDMSGYGNTGTIYGATQVPGLTLPSGAGTGKALSFNGVDDYVSVPHNNLFNPTSITISVWVYPKAYQSYSYIVNKYYHYILRFYSTTGRVENYTYINAVWRACTSPANMTAPLNQWSYLTHTYDGLQGKLYINSVLACTFNYSGAINTTGTNILKIGSYYTTANTTYRFKGLIDEVRIYAKALTLGEIQKQYAEGAERHQELVAANNIRADLSKFYLGLP